MCVILFLGEEAVCHMKQQKRNLVKTKSKILKVLKMLDFKKELDGPPIYLVI